MVKSRGKSIKPTKSPPIPHHQLTASHTICFQNAAIPITYTMQFTAALFALMATLAATAPTATLTARQPGVTWGAVGNLYRGGGCTDSSLIFADPVWGNSNECHPLDRFNDQDPIISYKAVAVNTGCTRKSILEKWKWTGSNMFGANKFRSQALHRSRLLDSRRGFHCWGWWMCAGELVV